MKKTLIELTSCLLENNKAHLCKLGEKLENEKELEDSEEYKKKVHKIWRGM